MLEERVKRLKEILDIQGWDGNWNYSLYMFGVYHGLALAVSIMDNEPPAYRDIPNEWIEDQENAFVEDFDEAD